MTRLLSWLFRRPLVIADWLVNLRRVPLVVKDPIRTVELPLNIGIPSAFRRRR